MDDTQKRFFELVTRYEALNKERKQIWTELELVMANIGVGTYLQDTDLTVYKITQPTGTYVEFKKVGYDRTAKADESRGTLSKTEAEAAGFAVFRKAK